MRVGRFATTCLYSMAGALVLMAASPSRALAQDGHAHPITVAPRELTPEQKTQDGALVQLVREVTDRFHNVNIAKAEGYALNFGCVSGGDVGAMGMHFINGPLVGDGDIDPRRPEIILYEPGPNGTVQLTGADYLVLADAWNAKHPDGPPAMMGQLFHLFDAPNRFGLPAFYTLHGWAWKDNPNGTFVNWHPKVSCDGFNAPNP